MKLKLTNGVAVILILGIVSIGAGDSAGQDETPFRQMIGGIKTGLDRSSNDYIAALFETAGATQCIQRGAEELCFHDARVIELYASSGNKVRKGSLIRLLGAGIEGGHSLFFVVPVDTELKVYGGTYGKAKPGEQEKVQFRDALRELGLGKDA